MDLVIVPKSEIVVNFQLLNSVGGVFEGQSKAGIFKVRMKEADILQLLWIRNMMIK